jgi:protein O-GlcNAc transferase
METRLNEIRNDYLGGRLAQAREGCQTLLESAPGAPEVLHRLALTAFGGGDRTQAEALLKIAIRACPENPVYYNDLGAMYRSRGAPARAAGCCRRALALMPDYADAHVTLSAALRDLGNLPVALVSAKRSLDLVPDHPEGLLNLALACHGLGLGDAAADAFARILARSPSQASAAYNLAVARMGQHRVAEAADLYRRALELRFHYPEAANGLSNALRVLGHWDEALASARQALKLRPDFPDALSHLAILMRSVCDWTGLTELDTRLAKLTRDQLAAGETTALQPMLSLWMDTDPLTRLNIAASHCRKAQQRAAAAGTAFEFESRRASARPLIVGYLSGDFRNHPVAQQVRGLFRRHDRTAFRIYAYAFGPSDGSALRSEIATACDCFVDLKNESDMTAAERIHRDRVDILVDLGGHTTGNRMGICALRPAPVQVSYIGFPGTTGAPWCDYFLTDRTATPEDQAAFYSEALVYLPHCYMATDDTQAVAASPAGRREVGLREDRFVFAAFTNFAKIDPLLFHTWMAVLRTLPHAVLWLPGGNSTAARNLLRAAAAEQIAAERLVFAEKLPSKAAHLARLRLADLALDTRIYNGHVSTCDALWAGLPVLTLQGDQFASRASASMLTAIGLPELVTHSLEEYQAGAVRLASDPAGLRSLRLRLHRNRASAPLFDTARFTRNLERALTAMWDFYCKGERPRTIEIHEP